MCLHRVILALSTLTFVAAQPAEVMVPDVPASLVRNNSLRSFMDSIPSISQAVYSAQYLSGLKAGEQYASKNSFAVKAEIGKLGATHDH